MALYTETVMDHFMHPRNVGEIENADGVGQVGNAKCGDIMKMYLKIKDNKIDDVKFETFGCGSAIASSSIATEMIKGKTIDEARSARLQAALQCARRGGVQVRHQGLLRQKRHCLRSQGVSRLRKLRGLPHGMTDSVPPRRAQHDRAKNAAFSPSPIPLFPLSGRGALVRPAFFYSRSPMASSSFCSARFSMRET